MKLISCKIENFGKLNNFTYSFTDGINVICEDNGWGKSTLASFIKIMLYGFEDDKSRDAYKNQRRRFKPWQGGIYGGHLIFEVKGKVYDLTRTFGTKESEDTFELRDANTNLLCNDFSDNIGEELFQIDRESYNRTVFVSQQDCEVKVTGGINAKIGNLTENTDDINNFENATDRIKKIINSLNPTRSTGSLYKMSSEIENLKIIVKGKASLDTGVKEILDLQSHQKDEYKKLDRQKSILLQKRKRICAYKDVQLKKSQYDNLCEDLQNKSSNLKEAQAKFPNLECLPKESELNALLSYRVQYINAENKVTSSTLNDVELARKEKLDKVFEISVPEDEELNLMYSKYQDLGELKVAIAKGKLTDEELFRYKSLSNDFQNDCPKKSTIMNYQNLWAQVLEKKSGLGSKKATLATLNAVASQNAVHSDKKRLSILMIIGMVMAVAGIITCLSNMALGVALVTVGLFFSVISIVSRSKAKTITNVGENSKETLRELENEIADEESFIQNSIKEINEFCMKYQIIFNETSILLDLTNLMIKVDMYHDLVYKWNKSQNKDVEKDYNHVLEEIVDFLEKYYSNINMEQLDAMLRQLERDKKEYIILCDKKRSCEKASKVYYEIKKAIETYLNNHEFNLMDELFGELEEIRENLKEYHRCFNETRKAEKLKYEFEMHEEIEKIKGIAEDNELREDIQSVDADIETISEMQQKISDSIKGYDVQLEELRQKQEDIEEAENKLTEWEEKYLADKRKYELLQMTNRLLQEAKVSFTSKYTKPVFTAFSKYYQMLTHTNPTNFKIDAESKLTITELGVQREPRFMSAGYQDLIYICMRMALIEAMYQLEKPVVIFDDPFVNLDTDKVNRGLELLNCIGESYQAIYLTCHKSRKLKVNS